MESTYGDKPHRSQEEAYVEMRDILRRTLDRGGKVIIPSLAVGRTQELVYNLSRMYDEDGLPEVPVYVDSPLAVNASKIFRKHKECYDEKMAELVETSHPALEFKNLTYINSLEESKALNERTDPMINISASGMAEAGRIVYHTLSRQQTEQLAMASVIRASEGVLDKQRWDRRYGDLLRLAASAPEVDRIFVNPVIKQALCRGGSRGDWLGKLRPWWGHDQHFHVRLACPADSPGCEPQKPIPAGDGCDEDLDGWVREIRLAAKRPKPAPPDRSATRLPLACDTVLAAASAPTRGGRMVIGARSGKSDQHFIEALERAAA